MLVCVVPAAGISIMLKKPDSEKPGVFSFTAPLHHHVWLAIFAAMLGVTVVLFVIRSAPHTDRAEHSIRAAATASPVRARSRMDLQEAKQIARNRCTCSYISPYEWGVETNAVGRRQVRRQFSLFNSFWFALSAFMQQSPDVNPKCATQ